MDAKDKRAKEQFGAGMSKKKEAGNKKRVKGENRSGKKKNFRRRFVLNHVSQ